MVPGKLGRPWLTFGIRLSVFPVTPQEAPADLWEQVVGAMPEMDQNQPRQRMRIQSGSWRGGALQLTVSSDRFVWLAGPSTTPEGFPDFENWLTESVVPDFSGIVRPWLTSVRFGVTPARMVQAGRGADHGFLPRHRLYRRCKSDEVIEDRLSPPSIKLENLSTNWSKYSKSFDVIFDYPGYGIGRLFVRDLPGNLPVSHPPGTPIMAHAFRPQHVPLPDNYAHSEIWVYRAGQRLNRVTSSVVKKEFRQIISDRSYVILQPTA
jgi:hypothetical protein